MSNHCQSHYKIYTLLFLLNKQSSYTQVQHLNGYKAKTCWKEIVAPILKLDSNAHMFEKDISHSDTDTDRDKDGNTDSDNTQWTDSTHCQT